MDNKTALETIRWIWHRLPSPQNHSAVALVVSTLESRLGVETPHAISDAAIMAMIKQMQEMTTADLPTHREIAAAIHHIESALKPATDPPAIFDEASIIYDDSSAIVELDQHE